MAAGRRCGDRLAFGRLYGRLRPLVERWVRLVVVDPWQSEEVVQDVFLEVWQIAGRYDPRHTAVAWIRTIAQRRAIDRVRSSQADRQRDLRIGARHLELVDHASLERAEGVLDRAALRDAVRSLPDRQREAVVLRHLVELSGPSSRTGSGSRSGPRRAVRATASRRSGVPWRTGQDRLGRFVP